MTELTKEKLDELELLADSCSQRGFGQADTETMLSLIAAARELKQMRSRVVFDVRSTYQRRSIGMSDADVLAKWLAGVDERGWKEPTNGR